MGTGKGWQARAEIQDVIFEETLHPVAMMSRGFWEVSSKTVVPNLFDHRLAKPLRKVGHTHPILMWVRMGCWAHVCALLGTCTKRWGSVHLPASTSMSRPPPLHTGARMHA